MQKKIIALAVAAVISSSAMAESSIYGTVDAALGSVSASGQHSDMLALSGGASTSRVGINASEELSNGLKAIVNLEYALDTQTANSIGAARQQLLGLTGGFGTFATGYLQTTGYDWENKFDPLAGTVASPLQSMNKSMLVGTVAQAARAQRALAYISPSMGGFTAAVNYSTAATGLGNVTQADTAAYKDTAWLASGTYAQGPAAVGLVLANAKGTALDVSDIALGGSFDLTAIKLYVTYQQSKISTPTAALAVPGAPASVTNKAMSISGVVPVMGSDAVAFSYAKNTADSNLANANGNAGASGFTVGYLHTMSKTLTAYAAYESVKNEAGTAAFSADNNALAASTAAGWVSGGGSSSLLAVGLRKKF